jgi:hypothetical protein
MIGNHHHFTAVEPMKTLPVIILSNTRAGQGVLRTYCIQARSRGMNDDDDDDDWPCKAWTSFSQPHFSILLVLLLVLCARTYGTYIPHLTACSPLTSGHHMHLYVLGSVYRSYTVQPGATKKMSQEHPLLPQHSGAAQHRELMMAAAIAMISTRIQPR